MKLTLSMSMDNAAFGDTPADHAEEVARILRSLADRMVSRGSATAGDSWALVDLNGNRVGEAQVDE